MVAVVGLPTALVLLALGECATGGPGDPAGTAAIAERSGPAGIAPELVYVTDLDGFDLATQSVGVVGDDGLGAVYTRADGDTFAQVLLTTAREPMPGAVPCADLSDEAAGGAALSCVVVRGDAHITLAGEGVDAATLRAAGEAVRVPGEDELGHLFADVQVPDVPVERGDLPAEGDGAPDNSVGEGG